jgi:hypothetical protein
MFWSFLINCGNSVITLYNKGIILIYSIKIIFHNSRDNERFFGKNNFFNWEGQEIEFVDVLYKLIYYALNANLNEVIFEIYAIQIGGKYLN